MARKYTVKFNDGRQVSVPLGEHPIELTLAFKSGNTVKFRYNPGGVSKIAFAKSLTQSAEPKGRRFMSRVKDGREWMEYESSDAEGTIHC